MMRDHLKLYLNGKPLIVSGADVFLTLSDFLRNHLGLIGTKVVCTEGDCGACTVLLGKVEEGRIRYRAIDSCILFMHQLDGTHVVSVEGLRRDGQLNAIQEAMVACHGSQCGFCTPGFVMMMTSLFENRSKGCSGPLSEDELRLGLSGNLCRCTGYVQIIEAGRSVEASDVPLMNQIYAEDELLPILSEWKQESVMIRHESRVAFVPSLLDEAHAFKAANDGVTVVSGATDLGVQCNKGIINPTKFLGLSKLDEMRRIQRSGDNLVIGATSNWGDMESAIEKEIPEFHYILTLFGSPQIRNSGSFGGNLINASPISDSIPFLMVSEAELELASVQGNRRVNINDFYQGYKKFDLAKDELLVSIHLPMVKDHLKLYKISRRKDMDISTFTAGIVVVEKNGVIESARIAFGGCGPVVYRLKKTEEFLQGKTIEESLFQEAGKLARTEISPISDVRGSCDFRFQLAENILTKFYHESFGEALVTP